jgi:hypothetical protein
MVGTVPKKRKRSRVAKETLSSHISGYSLPRLVSEAELAEAAKRLARANESYAEATAALQEAEAERKAAPNVYSLPVAELETIVGKKLDPEILERIHRAVVALCEDILSSLDGHERKRQSHIKMRPDGTRNQSLPEALKLAETMADPIRAWRAALNSPSAPMLMDFAAEASERHAPLEQIFAVLERESLMLKKFVHDHDAELRRDVQLLHRPHARFICALYKIATSVGMIPTVTRNTATRTRFTRLIMTIDAALPQALRRRLDRNVSFPSYICDVVEAYRH